MLPTGFMATWRNALPDTRVLYGYATEYKKYGPCKMYLKFTVFSGVRARVRGAISPILDCSLLFAAILGPECLVGFLFKVFLIFSSVPVVQQTRCLSGST